MKVLKETWKVERENGTTQVGDQDGYVIVDIDKHGCLEFGERADLIAAAPDLYRALEKVENLGAPDSEDAGDTTMGLIKLHAEIVAALKKARGET